MLEKMLGRENPPLSSKLRVNPEADRELKALQINAEAMQRFPQVATEPVFLVGQDEQVVSFSGTADEAVKLVSYCQDRPLKNVDDYEEEENFIVRGGRLKRTGIQVRFDYELRRYHSYTLPRQRPDDKTGKVEPARAEIVGMWKYNDHEDKEKYMILLMTGDEQRINMTDKEGINRAVKASDFIESAEPDDDSRESFDNFMQRKSGKVRIRRRLPDDEQRVANSALDKNNCRSLTFSRPDEVQEFFSRLIIPKQEAPKRLPFTELLKRTWEKIRTGLSREERAETEKIIAFYAGLPANEQDLTAYYDGSPEGKMALESEMADVFDRKAREALRQQCLKAQTDPKLKARIQKSLARTEKEWQKKQKEGGQQNGGLTLDGVRMMNLFDDITDYGGAPWNPPGTF